MEPEKSLIKLQTRGTCSTARVAIVYLAVVIEQRTNNIRSRTTLVVVGFFTTERGLALYKDVTKT